MLQDGSSHRLVLPSCRLECWFENIFDLIEASQEDYQIRLSMQDMPVQQKPVKASIVVVVRVVSVDQAVSAEELSVLCWRIQECMSLCHAECNLAN